jgi:hypothetical protein
MCPVYQWQTDMNLQKRDAKFNGFPSLAMEPGALIGIHHKFEGENG